jgi:hypothetical protein
LVPVGERRRWGKGHGRGNIFQIMYVNGGSMDKEE